MQITQTYAADLGAREAGIGRKYLDFFLSLPALLAVSRAWSQRRPAHPADLKRAGLTIEMQNRLLAMKRSIIE